MKPRDTALAVLVAFLWGLNFVALHVSLESMPPFLLLTLRFVLVALPAIFLVPKPDLPWRVIAAIGTATSLAQFSFLYLALRLGMPAGLSSLVLQAQVLFSVALGAVVLHERAGRAQLAGLGLGAVGLITIGVARGLSAPILPFILLLAAAFSWATGNIITRTAKAPGGLGLTVWSAVVVPIPALLLSLLMEGPKDISHSLTHLSIGSIIGLIFTVYCSTHVGYGVWNTLLSRYPVWQVTPFALLVPVFGMVATTVLLSERPSPLEWAGGALLLSGVALAALAPAVRARTSARRDRRANIGVEPVEEPSG